MKKNYVVIFVSIEFHIENDSTKSEIKIFTFFLFLLHVPEPIAHLKQKQDHDSLEETGTNSDGFLWKFFAFHLQFRPSY